MSSDDTPRHGGNDRPEALGRAIPLRRLRPMSSATEDALLHMVTDRLDQFEQGLVNLGQSAGRRFDALEKQIERLSEAIEKKG